MKRDCLMEINCHLFLFIIFLQTNPYILELPLSCKISEVYFIKKCCVSFILFKLNGTRVPFAHLFSFV